MDEMAESGKAQPFSLEVPIELGQTGASGEIEEARPQIEQPQRKSDLEKITPENFDALLEKEKADKAKSGEQRDGTLVVDGGPTEAEMKQADLAFAASEKAKAKK